MAIPVRVAAAWSWRLIIILASVGLVGRLLSTVALVLIPVLIAALLAGLLFPLVRWLRSKHVPAALASGMTVLALIGSLVGPLVVRTHFIMQ